jgi:rhodanese-related sulfurtransferase
MSIPRPIGDKHILDKKVPRNPRYENVGPVLDTGYNVKKFLEKHALHMHARFRKEEHFRRIKRSSLAQILQSAQPDGEIMLFDLRSADEYTACHITGAQSFPAATAHHSVNNTPPSMMQFINKENKMIVFYDTDEKVASQTANGFYERNVENIYVLTGGFPEFGDMYPELLSAPLPADVQQRLAQIKASPSSKMSVTSSRRYSSRTSVYSSVTPSKR